MPNPELLKFDGDPTRFSLFMANFEAHVESRLNPTDDASKLQCLIQHCEGEARKLISSFVLSWTSVQDTKRLSNYYLKITVVRM